MDISCRGFWRWLAWLLVAVAPLSAAAAPPEDPQAASASASAEVPGGFVRVWAMPSASDGQKSALFGQRIDADEKPLDPPRELRLTSGRIASLSLARHGADLWVSWVAQLQPAGKTPSVVVATVRTDTALKTVSKPITLRQYNTTAADIDPQEGLHSGLQSQALGRGLGGLVVAHQLTRGDENMRYFLWLIELAGPEAPARVRPLPYTGPKGGQPSWGGMLDIGTGVVVWANAWVGGATWNQVFIPYDPKTAPPKIDLLDCGPPISRFWNGQELSTYCHSDYLDDNQTCPIKGAESGMCPKVFVQRLDGTVLTPPSKKAKFPTPALLTSATEFCEGGRWVTELAWKGGKIRPNAPQDPPPKPLCQPGSQRPAEELLP